MLRANIYFASLMVFKISYVNNTVRARVRVGLQYRLLAEEGD